MVFCDPRTRLVLLGTAAFASSLLFAQPVGATFRDVSKTDWFASYIQDAQRLHIVEGYNDDEGNATGLFGPNEKVTLAEALKISIQAAYDTWGLSPHECGDCKVYKNHWAKKYAETAVTRHFQVFANLPSLDRLATRAEVAQIVADAFQIYQQQSSEPFFDVAADDKYSSAIGALTKLGILNGDTDVKGNMIGRFRPQDEINRAEVVKMAMMAKTRLGIESKPGWKTSCFPEMGLAATYPSDLIVGNVEKIIRDGIESRLVSFRKADGEGPFF